MNKVSVSALRRLVALSLCLVLNLARGQENEPYDADPPDRAGRLSYLQGDVSLQPAGEEEWTAAIVNRPLTTGDKLWTDHGARAEIEVGQAAVRLDGNTGFSFLNVDDNTIQMRMTAGVIDVQVRALAGNEQIEIDTPNLAVTVLRPGNYRVEVNDAGDTTVVKVSEGEAEVTGDSQDVIVHAQQAATFTGTGQLDSQFASLGAPDDFDSWSLEREQRSDYLASSRTAQYVSPDVTGYEDLDDNGTWSSEAEYGYVWTPRAVAVDWSPYRYGRWAWVAPWGWTWIDDAPWGYAPFHYGRWAHVRDRWCWVPGPRHLRAVYAPALVGWVGGGGVAWFPLGPREVYVPARRYSRRYFERVNLNNTVIVNRAIIGTLYNDRNTKVPYRNRGVAGGVTAVSRATFTSAQRVGGHRIGIDQQLARADATAFAPQIQPGRESRLGLSSAAAARRNVRVPPQAVMNRQVVVKRNPPPSGAHFARNVGPRDTMREPAAQADRPQVHTDRNVREDGARQLRPRTDRPPRVDQPRVDQPRVDQPRVDLPRVDQSQAGDAARQTQREPAVRQPQQYQPRDTRQIEQQQRGSQQRQINVERSHVERSSQAAPQPAPQSAPQPARSQPERSRPEPQHRPEPQAPAASNPQPQKPQDRQVRPRQRDL